MGNVMILSWESIINNESNIINIEGSCIILLILGYILLLVPGSVRSIFGLIVITFSISFELCIYGMLFIPLIFLSSLLGLVMILFLLRYGSSSSYEENDIDLFDFLLFFFLFLIFPFFSSTSSSISFFSSNNISLLYFGIILDSSLLVSFLFAIVFIATLLLIHLSSKILYFNISSSSFFSLISFWFCDAFILFFIGLFLCYLPAFLRWFFSRSSGNVSGSRWRENVFRWSSDVYEVGISVPGPSLPSSLFGKNGDSEAGSFRFLAFVYLFLLLDLESCIALPIIFGFGQLFFGLLFFLILLLSTSCELSLGPLS